MQKIRDYMEAFPDEGKKLRRENRSYVFFRETDLGEFEEAIGAQGVSLTDGRSLAVDRRLHTYGMPFFVDAVLPIQSEKPDTIFRRLMIAQDTGGAIVGPARADIYLGAGEEAARAAGRFKHFGKMTMLVPNALSAGDSPVIPLPLPKPKDGEEAKTVEFVPVVDPPESKAPESKVQESKIQENRPPPDAAAGKSGRVAAPESKPQTDASAGSTKVTDRVEKPAQTVGASVPVPLPKARPLPRKP
jgi:membrane-bound lytic murein transglycosylase A